MYSLYVGLYAVCLYTRTHSPCSCRCYLKHISNSPSVIPTGYCVLSSRDFVVGRSCKTRSFTIWSFSPAVIREIKWDGRGMWHVWGRREVHTGTWWGNFREGDLFGDLSKGDRIILKWINKYYTWVKNGFISVNRYTRQDGLL